MRVLLFYCKWRNISFCSHYCHHVKCIIIISTFAAPLAAVVRDYGKESIQVPTVLCIEYLMIKCCPNGRKI